MHRIYLAATMGYDLGSDDPNNFLITISQKRNGLYEKGLNKKVITLNWDIQVGLD